MKLGDLVIHMDRHWLVSRYDPKRTRTATLLAEDGATIEVVYDLDAVGGVRVIGNPSRQWPFIAVPEKPRWGKITGILRPVSLPCAVPVRLTMFHDWVAADPVRPGGPVFLNPALQLCHGDVLLVEHGKNLQRFPVPPKFGTVAQLIAARNRHPPEERNAFTRLLAEDQIGDD